jgi:hypothetical protein
MLHRLSGSRKRRSLFPRGSVTANAFLFALWARLIKCELIGGFRTPLSEYFRSTQSDLRHRVGRATVPLRNLQVEVVGGRK